MAQATDSYIDSAERLCATLERIGDALVTLDAATLLETEESLARLVAVLSSGEAPEGSADLEPIVKRGRTALLRCRRLGASYGATAKVRLQFCTGVGPYDRDGDLVERTSLPPALKATA